MQESSLSLPVGCFFRPSDENLVAFYLFNKISGNPIPFVDHLVPDYNLYGSVEPWTIWDLFGGPNLEIEQDLFFFTQLNKKTVKGSRISRKVGSGSWQGEDAATVIVSRKSNLEIGSKKRFRYENKGSQQSGRWILHEYSLNLSSFGLDHQQFSGNNYVICRLRKNDQPTRKRYSGKKRKFEEQVESNQLLHYEDHKNAQHTPCDFGQNQQKRPATELRGHRVQFEVSECQEYMFHTPPEPEANQQTPLTEHSSLSEDYQFMSHSPSDQLEENTKLLVTEQTPRDQLELIENGQRMSYVPHGLEESQQLFMNEQSPDCQLQHSDYYTYMDQHLSDLEVNQRLPFTEESPLQHILPTSANLEENQQLVTSTAQHTNIDEVVYSNLTEDNSYVPNDFLYGDDYRFGFLDYSFSEAYST